MRSFKILSLFFVALFAVSLVVPASNMQIVPANIERDYWISEDLPSNSTYVNAIRDDTHFRVSDDTQYYDGLNLFSLGIYPNHTDSNDRVGYLLVADMDGNIRNGFYSDFQPGSPKLINSTSALYTVRGEDGIFFWNWVDNKTQWFNVSEGHHEVVYNPVSQTFLTMQGVDVIEDYNFTGDLYQVVNDDIVEYDMDGTELWRWEGNITFPFNIDEFHLRNETRRDELDWTHTNSLYWDIDNGMIYMNVRHLDCVVAVDYNTGETAYVFGRYTGENPGMTMYNKYGEEVDSLFYHAHACEVIGPNRFILYDNDYKNITRPDINVGITRLIEVEIDTDANTATEVWSWTSPESYFCRAQGDANRFPNGNTIGVHNQAPSPFMTEVNQAGEIVWEWTFNKTDAHIGWRLSPNGHMRFRVEPTIELAEPVVTIAEGGTASVHVSLWDTFQRPVTEPGKINATSANMVTLAYEEFDFLPHWQETEVVLEIPGLQVGTHLIQILVENVDGIQSEVVVTVEVTSNMLLYVGIGAIVVVALVVIVVFMKKRA